MKATLSLMFLLVGLSSSFAQQTQIDRFYFDQGVYRDDSDQAEFIQVTDQGALTGCSHSTPVGVACKCVHGIIIHKPSPGFTLFRPLAWVRDGWHVTNYKGEHGGGDVCYRDRAPTQEEIERYHRTRH
jgi:hypothetical protein